MFRRNEDEYVENATVQHADDAEVQDEKQWEDIGEKCILCDKPIEDSKIQVVKERGIKSLIEASIKRKDDKHLYLSEQQQITVHKTCQNMYGREANIKIALLQRNKAWKNNRKRRQDGREFGFGTYCFFFVQMILAHETRVLECVINQLLIIS